METCGAYGGGGGIPVARVGMKGLLVLNTDETLPGNGSAARNVGWYTLGTAGVVLRAGSYTREEVEVVGRYVVTSRTGSYARLVRGGLVHVVVVDGLLGGGLWREVPLPFPLAVNVLAVEGAARVLEVADSPRRSAWPSGPRWETLRLSELGVVSRARLLLLSESAICGDVSVVGLWGVGNFGGGDVCFFLMVFTSERRLCLVKRDDSGRIWSFGG